MKYLKILIFLLPNFVLLNYKNFYNINVKSIEYELTYNNISYVKIKIISGDIIGKKLLFKAFLKSSIKKNEYLLECKSANKFLIECYAYKNNLIFDIHDKYYFFYNYTDKYNLTFNLSKNFEDRKRISLIFKPKILLNQTLYKNYNKLIVITNNNMVKSGYLYAVKENKKILNNPKDGFNKYIELNNFISHAGLSAYRPQSSLIAYKEAIRRGFKIVDADIQFTKDKIPVICHGKILEKVSNGKGLLNLKTLKELQNLDFGNKNYKNIKITTFEELLELCKKNKIIIDLDLFHMDFKKYFKESEEYAKIIINTVKKYNYFNSIIFNSGHNIEKISILKRIKKDIAISIDDMNQKKNIEKIKDKFRDSKRIIFNMGGLLHNNNRINEETVKYGLSLGHKIKAAKVNNLGFANKISKWGVNFITTQYLHPFLIQNQKEEPIKLKCISKFLTNFSECILDKNIKLRDNEIYNIYYSNNIYNLSEDINEIPIGKIKYLNTNFDNKLFYSIKYLNFTEGIIKLYISNIIKKGKYIKGTIGPSYENVAKCYLYSFICSRTRKGYKYINCKINKNKLNKIKFKGNYTIYYLENYTLINKDLELYLFIKNMVFLFIHINIIIILLILKYNIKKKFITIYKTNN